MGLRVFLFYLLLFCYGADGIYAVDPVTYKPLKLTIVKITTDLKWLIIFIEKFKFIIYHSSVFFIIPLSEAVYLRSFGGMSECNIFSIVFNTHTYTDTLFIAIYMY